MWDLPGPGLKPVSPALAGGFLTTAPPEKPQNHASSLAFKREYLRESQFWAASAWRTTPTHGLYLGSWGSGCLSSVPSLSCLGTFFFLWILEQKGHPASPHFHCAGKDVEIQDCHLSHLLQGVHSSLWGKRARGASRQEGLRECHPDHRVIFDTPSLTLHPTIKGFVYNKHQLKSDFLPY